MGQLLGVGGVRVAEASKGCVFGRGGGGAAAAGVMVVRGGGRGLDMSWKFPEVVFWSASSITSWIRGLSRSVLTTDRFSQLDITEDCNEMRSKVRLEPGPATGSIIFCCLFVKTH